MIRFYLCWYSDQMIFIDHCISTYISFVNQASVSSVESVLVLYISIEQDHFLRFVHLDLFLKTKVLFQS